MLTVIVAAMATACSLSTDTRPSQIVLPPTDVLSTESAPETTTSTPDDISDTGVAPDLPDWTIGRVIALAPRVDNSRYRQGSVTPNSRLQNVSGYHFSTADRAINCSVGTNGSRSLACRLNTQSPAGRRPSDTPTACTWAANLVTLSTEGPRHGACADLHPVLFRSSILDYGHTISISRFSCLADTSGLFCLDSHSNTGFAVTATVYRTINATDRAPASLVGISETETTDSITPTIDGPPETPTTTRPTS
ncbi:hypothetical protein ACWDTI_13535 [Gordonia sp. NPDC003424]